MSQSVINDCNLLDGGYVGSNFTWQRGNTYRRLDRVLFNLEWRMLYQDMTVYHLSKFKSDHCPLWLDFGNKQSPNKGRRPFRFLAAWCTHEDLPNIVHDNWSSTADWNRRIKNTQEGLKKWNDSVFGNIFKRKRELMRRLDGISRSLAQDHNRYLEKLQKDLWIEYEKVLSQEEILWFQKSRCKWINFGDRNTRYFHGTTIVRRKRNRIESLQGENGVWIENTDQLEQYAYNYFKEFYKDDEPYQEFCLHGAFPTLSEEQVNLIKDNVTDAEIKNAVFAMGSLKAPGKDGLHAIFYKSQWGTVGQSLCKLVKDCFHDPMKIKEINDTLICLIPKVDDVLSLKQLRPISFAMYPTRLLQRSWLLD